MATRSIAVTAAVAAGAALVATGITYASAASEPAQAAAVSSALQGNNGNNNNNNDNGKGNEGYDHDHENNNENKKHYEKKIYVNEREYNAHDQGCIVVVSGLGANSLNVRNDSKETVEVFNGATCDNGAPIATVGPKSSSNGLVPRRVRGGVKVRNGVVASFRVVHRFDHDNKDNDHDNDNDNDYDYNNNKGK
ncbi:hypothetical protein ABZ876_14900 [Streptomyces sp. NPDC046931]|uniref:hypothetical protein n=1 Tax=Streptomyces sp. NPDC046931 TaxID=3154806 RepID=UPI0033FB7267